MKTIEEILQQTEKNNKGGFFDLPKMAVCKDKNHNPPSHLFIPQGKGYKHVCPTCGKEFIIVPTQVSL